MRSASPEGALRVKPSGIPGVGGAPPPSLASSSPRGGESARELRAEVERLREALKTQTAQCNLVGKRLLVLQHARGAGAGAGTGGGGEGAGDDGGNGGTVSREEHERVVAEWKALRDKVDRKATALLAAESMCGRLTEAAEAERAEAEAEYARRLDAERERIRGELLLLHAGDREDTDKGKDTGKDKGEGKGEGEGEGGAVVADGERVVRVLQAERAAQTARLAWALWRTQTEAEVGLRKAGERAAAEARRAEEEAEGLREELDYLREESEKAEIRLADELAETQRKLAKAEGARRRGRRAGKEEEEEEEEEESDSDEESDVDQKEAADALQAEVEHLREERDELMRKYQARIVELEEQARVTAELSRAEEKQQAKAGLEEQARLYAELQAELDTRQAELDGALAEVEALSARLKEKEAAAAGEAAGDAEADAHAKEVARLKREIEGVREQAAMEAEVREEMLRRTRQSELSALADENADLKARLAKAEAEVRNLRASSSAAATPASAASKQPPLSASKSGSADRAGTGQRSGRVLRSRNAAD